MATLTPRITSPSFAQHGQTSQRLSGTFFMAHAEIPELVTIPLAVGAATVTTSTIDVRGFNTFMCLLDVTVAQITLKVVHVDPTDQVTQIGTRTVLVVAPSGFQIAPFGYGNSAALGGVDVFQFIRLQFVGLAGSILNQFPGLWGAVR